MLDYDPTVPEMVAYLNDHHFHTNPVTADELRAAIKVREHRGTFLVNGRVHVANKRSVQAECYFAVFGLRAVPLSQIERVRVGFAEACEA